MTELNSDRVDFFRRDFEAVLYKYGFETCVFICNGKVYEYNGILGIPEDGEDVVCFAIDAVCPCCDEDDHDEQ